MGKKVKMKGDANRSKIEKANPCLPKKALKKSSINCRNMVQNKVKKQKINNEDIERLVFEER